MNKVNLDELFEKWKKENLEYLKEKFLDIHRFEDYIEEMWRQHQDENDLIDKSNEAENE